MDWITLAGTVLEEVLSLAASATSGQTQNIINIVDKFLAVAVNSAPSLLQPLQNIVAALSSNGAITADQLAALQTQSATLDAALDAAAADDKLT